jgi:hypothetical protein
MLLCFGCSCLGSLVKILICGVSDAFFALGLNVLFFYLFY